MDPNSPQPGQSDQKQPPHQTPPHPGQPSAAQPYSTVADQPVAYDNQGRPLYAHPQGGQPQMVYMSRPMDPVHPPISEDAKRRHAESKKRFPGLNLSDGEYVISAVKRHPIGLVRIWGIALIIVLALIGMFTVLFAQDSGAGVDNAFGASSGAFAAIGLGVIAFMMILVAIGALIATYVYEKNEFYLTNESVIQEIQVNLFSRHEQTVSLANIEDASYEQNGILPHILNYGRIRLSTEGDETTYRFSYVSTPKRHIAILNNAVEAFKNGRPVDPNEN